MCQNGGWDTKGHAPCNMLSLQQIPVLCQFDFMILPES